MSNENREIDFNSAIAEVRKACIQMADLYFHLSKVLVEDLGEEKAEKLVEKVVRSRAIERGQNLRKVAIEKNLPCTVENWLKVTDIPFLGWDKSLGKYHCPYGEGWLGRYEEDPWFPKFAKMYCDVNDSQVTETFTGNMSQRILKNVVCGDETCEREYFPLVDKDVEDEK